MPPSPWRGRFRGRAPAAAKGGPSRNSPRTALPGSVEIDRLCRAEWGRLLSALIRDFGDFDLAEEALQAAFASAVSGWERGTPRNPRGWLYAAARHDVIDRLRRT